MFRQKKTIAIIAVIMLLSSLFVIPASASMYDYDEFSVEEAVLYSCQDNGTLIKKIGTNPQFAYTRNGYTNIHIPRDDGGIVGGFVTSVIGIKVKPEIDEFSLTLDCYFNYPVYVSWAALTTKDGRSVFGEMQALTEGKDTSTPNSQGVYGYRFKWRNDEYKDYLSLHLVSNIPWDFAAGYAVNLIGTFDYEYPLGAEGKIEENKANKTGNEGADKLGSLIPNNSGGLISAFTNLTASMVHNDTACKITFPGIKIPKLKVKGIEFGDVTLLGESEINFEDYVALIPETYLKLVRSLCTIALIIYCFKEMYSLFSFIFTAKGGGDSE